MLAEASLRASCVQDRTVAQSPRVGGRKRSNTHVSSDYGRQPNTVRGRASSASQACRRYSLSLSTTIRQIGAAEFGNGVGDAIGQDDYETSGARGREASATASSSRSSSLQADALFDQEWRAVNETLGEGHLRLQHRGRSASSVTILTTASSDDVAPQPQCMSKGRPRSASLLGGPPPLLPHGLTSTLKHDDWSSYERTEQIQPARRHEAPEEVLLPFLDRAKEVHELLFDQSAPTMNHWIAQRLQAHFPKSSDTPTTSPPLDEDGEEEFPMRSGSSRALSVSFAPSATLTWSDLSRLLYASRTQLPDRQWLSQLRRAVVRKSDDLWASFAQMVGADLVLEESWGADGEVDTDDVQMVDSSDEPADEARAPALEHDHDLSATTPKAIPDESELETAKPEDYQLGCYFERASPQPDSEPETAGNAEDQGEPAPQPHPTPRLQPQRPGQQHSTDITPGGSSPELGALSLSGASVSKPAHASTEAHPASTHSASRGTIIHRESFVRSFQDFCTSTHQPESSQAFGPRRDSPEQAASESEDEHRQGGSPIPSDGSSTCSGHGHGRRRHRHHHRSSDASLRGRPLCGMAASVCGDRGEALSLSRSGSEQSLDIEGARPADKPEQPAALATPSASAPAGSTICVQPPSPRASLHHDSNDQEQRRNSEGNVVEGLMRDGRTRHPSSSSAHGSSRRESSGSGSSSLKASIESFRKQHRLSNASEREQEIKSVVGQMQEEDKQAQIKVARMEERQNPSKADSTEKVRDGTFDSLMISATREADMMPPPSDSSGLDSRLSSA